MRDQKVAGPTSPNFLESCRQIMVETLFLLYSVMASDHRVVGLSGPLAAMDRFIDRAEIVFKWLACRVEGIIRFDVVCCPAPMQSQNKDPFFASGPFSSFPPNFLPQFRVQQPTPPLINFVFNNLPLTFAPLIHFRSHSTCRPLVRRCRLLLSFLHLAPILCLQPPFNWIHMRLQRCFQLLRITWWYL